MTTEYRGYGHDVDLMIAAAIKWVIDHRGEQVPKLRWDIGEGDGVLIIGDLTPWIETIAMNAAGSAFLKAINAAVDGRATVIMAQTVHYEATRARE
jgi:hypothetical protein